MLLVNKVETDMRDLIMPASHDVCNKYAGLGGVLVKLNKKLNGGLGAVLFVGDNVRAFLNTRRPPE